MDKGVMVAGLLAGGLLYAAYRFRNEAASADMNGGASDGDDGDVFGLIEVAAKGVFVGSVNNKVVSLAGANFIRQFEGFRGYVYDANPPKGDWTIGYGHKIKPGESFTTINESQAFELLKKDLRMAENRVNGSIGYVLNQAQFDALASLAFNLTWASWKKAAARLNAGESAESVINRYVYAGAVKLAGLVRRRAAEVAIYKTGKYA